VKHVKDGKVAVYATAVDTQTTETKGTVLLHNADELESYSRGEERKMEEHISAIAQTGAKVVVGNSNFGELALHFIERYGMMAIKVPSKFELRRFCRAVGATQIVQLQQPQDDELGYVSSLDVQEIGGHKCTVVRQKDADSQIATIVLRGATENVIDDVERAVDDGVNAFRTACRDPRLLPAGGATELALSRKLREEAKRESGLEQYAIDKFAEALEIIPRVIAENSGLNSTDTLSNLHAAHASGNSAAGVDIEGDAQVKDLSGDGIFDLHGTKSSAMQLLVDAACTVLRVVRF
jgi:T-complex protein 1 subunit theta